MAEISGGAQLPFYGEVPSENVASTLDNYQPNDERQQYALELARAFVETDETPAGLLLVGAPGNGKTHLAVGIGRAIAAQGKTAALIGFKEGMPSLKPLATMPDAPLIGWNYEIPELTATAGLSHFLHPQKRLYLADLTATQPPMFLHSYPGLLIRFWKMTTTLLFMYATTWCITNHWHY